MFRVAYVNGRYVPHGSAGVHVEDRGYQFADGVYEVCEVRDGRLIDERRHMDRLDRSLGELRIGHPMSRHALGVVLREVARRNRVRNGIVYLQVTRGVAPRDHAFPGAHVPPSIVVTARSGEPVKAEARAGKGIAVVSVTENRWERVDIKSVGLLPNVMAKQQAREAGAYEAWFVRRDGTVTEGSSTNAWIVTRKGALVTHPAASGILRGVTRSVLVDLLPGEKLTLEERPFTLKEVLAARESFITSATSMVTPVVSVDGKKIGNGRPGPVATSLRRALQRASETAPQWSGPA